MEPVADNGGISSFVIHYKGAGGATKLLSSPDLLVFSAHCEAWKYHVSIIGTVFSRLSITSLIAA